MKNSFQIRNVATIDYSQVITEDNMQQKCPPT